MRAKMRAKNPLPRPSQYEWYRCYPLPAGRRHGPVLTSEEMVQCRKAVVEVILRRTRCGEPITGLPELLARLDDVLILSSAHGTTSGTNRGELEVPKLIDTTEAAALLGCSREWVCKLAPRLGGQFVGGNVWVLPLETVLQHAAGKEPS